MPTVSVIVPNYNHARFLRQRIDTILTQTYQDFELILLDDCSTDDSRSVLCEYASDPRVRVEFNDVNSGTPFKQWNKGVRLARGKYVWIAESDDYADPRLLQRLIALIESDAKTVIAYCRSWWASEDGSTNGFADGYVPFWDPRGWGSDWRMSGPEACRKYFCGTNRIPNASGALFRRDVYERVGGADETMRLCGDWKLWAAMILEGDIAYTADALNYFRYHKRSQRERVHLGDTIIEQLHTSIWVLDRIEAPEPSALRTLYLAHATVWVPAMLSRRVARSKKEETIRLLRKIDPHPLLTAARFAPTWIGWVTWDKVARVWYPILDFTYDLRHATGLTRDGFGRLRARIANR